MKVKLILLFVLLPILVAAQTVVSIPSSGYKENFGKEILVFEDVTSAMSLEQVMNSTGFETPILEVPNLGVSNSAFWVKLILQNNSGVENLLFDLRQSNLDDVTFYFEEDSIHIDDRTKLSERGCQNQDYIFPVNIKMEEVGTVYLRVKSGDQIQLPITIGTSEQILKELGLKDLYFGIYTGISFAMLLSAILIFMKTKDRMYLLYVGYVAIVYLTQANFQGYTLRFIWPNNPFMERYCVYVLSAVVGIVGSVFIINYLQLKQNAPWSIKIFYAIFFVYPFVVIPAFFGYFNFSYNVLQAIAASSAFFVLFVAVYCWRRDVRQAGNLLIAWSIFLVGIVIFVMKDFGIVPYNSLTYNVMTIGSAIEGVLLSFGLADKINQLKLEKEESDSLRIATIESQNEMLEEKVHERTAELEDAKDHIQSQYDHLRIAQKQLVESEKLAGLGQMTAGIAHELNNPINFVTSNVGPLHRDIEDVVNLLNDYQRLPEDASPEQIRELKTKYEKSDIDYVQKEIHQLLNGIEEGSKRTAEIVRGLRIFARADKDTLVSTNINECLQSTIVVLKSVTKGEVTLTRELDPAMPPLECYPGKLNQVIANLISNATQATKLPGRNAANRIVNVRSYFNENEVCISVKDNGSGISEAIKEKMFLPFFTTKAVGEGTGLGLSIAMGIIEEHQGSIEVLTSPGDGSEFIIHLPRSRRGKSLVAA